MYKVLFGYTLSARLSSSSDRNSEKIFHSGAVDGKALFYLPLEIFEYYTQESSRRKESQSWAFEKGLFHLSVREHLHVPMEGIKLLPGSTIPSAFTNNQALVHVNDSKTT